MTSLSGSLAGSVAGPLSGLGAGGATIEDILGDLLVEYWDARYGVGFDSGEVESWTGQKLGMTTAAPVGSPRCTFTTANESFNGQPTVATDATANRTLRMSADWPTDLIASNGRPYMAVVGALTPGDVDVFFTLNGPGDGSLFDLLSVDEDLRIRANASGAAVASFATPDAEPHFYEAWIEADNSIVLAIDGATVAINPSGAALTDAVRRAHHGSHADGYVGTGVLAQTLFCTSVPSTAQRAALLALAHETWGIPITVGFAFVVAGGSRVTGAGGQIIGGGT